VSEPKKPSLTPPSGDGVPPPDVDTYLSSVGMLPRARGETVRETIVRTIRESEEAMSQPLPPSTSFWSFADKAVAGLCETLALLFCLPFGDDLYNNKPVTELHLFYLAIGLVFAVTGPMWPLIRTISWIPEKVSASFSRAALDARIWVAILLLLFVYGTAPEIYQRATQPKPQLQISIREVNVYEVEHVYGRVISITVDARIWNTGAPTYAVDWGLTALTREKGRLVATWPNDTPKAEEALDRKTENTLVGDKPITGKLIFYFRVDELSRAEFLNPKTEIILSVKDAYGNVAVDKESIAKWLQR
jgi:hypothetical protein